MHRLTAINLILQHTMQCFCFQWDALNKPGGSVVAGRVHVQLMFGELARLVQLTEVLTPEIDARTRVIMCAYLDPKNAQIALIPQIKRVYIYRERERGHYLGYLEVQVYTRRMACAGCMHVCVSTHLYLYA